MVSGNLLQKCGTADKIQQYTQELLVHLMVRGRLIPRAQFKMCTITCTSSNKNIIEINRHMNGKHIYVGILNMILSQIRSQCNPLNTGVICSLELEPVTILAATFLKTS